MSSLLVSETTPCALHPAIPVHYKDDTVGVSLTTPHIHYIGHFWSTAGMSQPTPLLTEEGPYVKSHGAL